MTEVKIKDDHKGKHQSVSADLELFGAGYSIHITGWGADEAEALADFDTRCREVSLAIAHAALDARS